jgi:recombination protein RecT
MSASALKAAATGRAIAPKKEDPVASLIEKLKPQMALALPKHLNPERMGRIMLTEMRRVPKLAECGKESLLGALMMCSQLGLEPGNGLGHAYLLPFERRAKVGGQWQTVGIDCQLIVGYRGMIDLARRSGQIVSIAARTVHKNDHFAYRLGLDETIEHIPADGERGDMTHVYAVAKLKDGGVQFEVMSKHDIEKVRLQSKAKDNGPWQTHFDEMAKKTAIRRLFKYLPVSIEMQRAVTIDEQADAGILQDHNVVDMETGEYTPPPELEHSPSAAFADQITAAKTPQELQAIGEAMEAMPDGDEKEALTQALMAREDELAPKA